MWSLRSALQSASALKLAGVLITVATKKQSNLDNSTLHKLVLEPLNWIQAFGHSQALQTWGLMLWHQLVCISGMWSTTNWHDRVNEPIPQKGWVPFDCSIIFLDSSSKILCFPFLGVSGAPLKCAVVCHQIWILKESAKRPQKPLLDPWLNEIWHAGCWESWVLRSSDQILRMKEQEMDAMWWENWVLECKSKKKLRLILWQLSANGKLLLGVLLTIHWILFHYWEN